MTHIDTRLKEAGLRGVLQNWNAFSEHIAILEKLLECEEAYRTQEHRRVLLEKSGIQQLSSMSIFDWNWPKSIPKDVVQHCLDLQPIDDKRNVILIGPNGVGKTMIAQNIVMNAINKGIRSSFMTASTLLNKLTDAANRKGGCTVERLIQKYATIPLLVIDEIGYISYASLHTDLLFQLINRRYEKTSTVITTNIRLSQWNTIFPNMPCLAAMIDRLVYHSEIIKIEGASWRTREHMLNKASDSTSQIEK